MMKIKLFKRTFVTTVCIILCTVLSCSGGDDIPVSPSLNAPTRAMLKETVNVYLNGVKEGTEFSVDFGDGTIMTGTAPAPVRHPYIESGDYELNVFTENISLNKRIRVYDLLALSEAQKQFKDPDNNVVWVMTHRAHTTDYSIPENSISAVNAAIASGAEAIELDTHRTKDGYIVVCHDQTIDRTTNGTGDITKMTLAEIRQYNLTDRNGRVTDEKMPTLEEFLKAGRGKIYFDLDYSPRTASTQEVMAIVKELDMMEQCWFYCNSTAKVEEVLSVDTNAHAYPWATQYSPLKDLEGNYFVQYSYTPNGGSTPLGNAPKDGMLISVILLGSQKIPFDRVDDKQLDELLQQFPGVHMIMTDCPAQLITALDKRGLR